MNKRLNILFLLAVISVWYSCSPTKHLKEGQALYTGGDVKFKPDTGTAPKLKDDLESLLRPKPNSSFMGLYPKLYFYNISKKPTGKGLNYLLHEKWGEPPVLGKELNLTANENILENYLQNRGFFQVLVDGDSTEKRQRVKAHYTIDAGKRYMVHQIFFPEDSSLLINREIDSIKKESLLKPGEYYDLETIKAERERIKDSLKNKGYFYFTPDNLIVQVDSTLDGNVDMYVKIKEEAPQAALKKYRIKKVNVYSNYTLKEDSVYRSREGKEYKGLNIIDPKNDFRPSVFYRSIYMTPGNLYTLEDHELTLNRLVNLNAFKFV